MPTDFLTFFAFQMYNCFKFGQFGRESTYFQRPICWRDFEFSRPRISRLEGQIEFQLTPTCFAMLLLLLGIEDLDQIHVGDQTHKEGAHLQGSRPSPRLVLLVIALILCHIGAVVS